MRIALLAHCHHPIAQPYAGGLEMHTALLAEELVQRGHDVTLYAKAGSSTPARLRAVVDAAFVHGPPVPGRPHPDAVLDAAMRRVVDELGSDVDVVLNNSLSPIPYGHLHHLPMLTLLHTPATLDRVTAVVQGRGWQPADRHAWAGVSHLTSRDWRRLLPEVAVIPNGVDLAHWTPRGVPVREPRQAVWAGRITPEKGLSLAIAAARLAGWRLAVAGPVSDRRYFETEIAPELDTQITYRGHLGHDELPGFLQSGSVFVFSPLWPEPFGLALVEALACGTPAAALPTGAVREIVGARAGVVARAPTAEALAAAMAEAALLNHHGVMASVQHLDKTTMIEAYEQVLAELVGTAGLTRPPADLDVDYV